MSKLYEVWPLFSSSSFEEAITNVFLALTLNLNAKTVFDMILTVHRR